MILSFNHHFPLGKKKNPLSPASEELTLPRHCVAGSEAAKLDAEPIRVWGAPLQDGWGAAVSQRNACFVASGQGWAGPADHLVSHSTSPPSSLFRFFFFSFFKTKPQVAWKGAAFTAGSRARSCVLSQGAKFRQLTPVKRALLPAPHPLLPGSLWAPDPGGPRALEAEGVWGRASWETIALLNFPLSNNCADKILGWGRCPPFPQAQPQSEL